jgi:hypothetical protein
MARILIIAGIVCIAAGVIWWLAGDKLTWLGRLPGDIRIEKPGFKFYFPLTSTILISIVISLIIRIIKYLIKV